MKDIFYYDKRSSLATRAHVHMWREAERFEFRARQIKMLVVQSCTHLKLISVAAARATTRRASFSTLISTYIFTAALHASFEMKR